VLLVEDSIEQLFMGPLVYDRDVVVVSIAGAFRKGKSFLMNYMLRYLYANVSWILIDFWRKVLWRLQDMFIEEKTVLKQSKTNMHHCKLLFLKVFTFKHF
jgi:Guanylate-binding protein, N-terminal domain